MLSSFITGLTDLFFPLNCVLCGTYAPETRYQPLCRRCLTTIPYNDPPFCQCCSRHLESVATEALCRDCREQPPAFDGAWVLTRYAPPMNDLIHRFKFQNKTSLRKTFRLITKNFQERCRISLSADLLIPIPVHPVRLRERGYNQSALLAQAVNELTGIPVLNGVLQRTLLTPPQRGLERKERWTNIRGAFRIASSSGIKEKNIYIIDDLLTTGATASEAARVLKEAGAARVELLALSAA